MGAETSCLVMPVGMPDSDLVEAVRAGDDGAFEELYRRYEKRIEGFVGRMVRDPGRVEDVTQEVFFAALRRLRATEGELAFKPWIYEIARNASIDLYRRMSRAEEVPIEEEAALGAADRARLVSTVAPDAVLHSKERLAHLRGALAELPHNHNRILVLRELEGLSYREIADRMEMTRGAVESTLFRARRRLEAEFSEIDTGRRCAAVQRLAARQAAGDSSARERLRLDRHLGRCPSCARHARDLGLERVGERLATKVAALVPLPALLRRRQAPDGLQSPAASGPAQPDVPTWWASVASQGTDAAAILLGKSAILLAAAAMTGVGATLGGGGPLAKQLRLDRDQAQRHAHAAPPRAGAAGPHRLPASTGSTVGRPADRALESRRAGRPKPRERLAGGSPKGPDRPAGPTRKPAGPALPSVPRVQLPKVQLPRIQTTTPRLQGQQAAPKLPKPPGEPATRLPPASVPDPARAPEVGSLSSAPEVARGVTALAGPLVRR